jgi:hypothetical protein
MKTKHPVSQPRLPQTEYFKLHWRSEAEVTAMPKREINRQQPFFKWRAAALITMMLVLAGTTSWATVETFATSTTWTCPAGVTTVTVECWGGGGAGGSAKATGGGSSPNATVGGGGAGGAYVIKSSISVTPGNPYTVTVGAGGTADITTSITDGDHGDGGDSWFNTTGTVLAKGGAGGFTRSAARPAQGNGGICPSGSVGDTINLGGSGSAGVGSAPASGAGGGSGGTSSVGNNASGTTGGTAVTGGGIGANGRTSTGGGSTPSGVGGGGGGAESASSTGQQGGSGAAGKVAITYTLPAATYTWSATSGSADWTSAASWSPSRTTPAINDILVFNQGGSSTATSVPAQTIGKLQVSGGTIINLQAGAANTLMIGETASDSLTVAGGSQLNISGTSALLINVSTGAKGSISGSMTFSATAATAHSLTAADAGGITFNSGSTFTQGTNDTGNVFGNSGAAGTVVFASGSAFIQQGGNNPFGPSNPKVVFQTGSLFSLQQNAQPSASGKTYANFEYNINATNAVSGGSPLNMDNLSVVQGAFNVNMAGGFNLNGNASVASGATLNLNNTVTTAGGKTFTVNGTLGGTATIGGGAAITISSTGTVSPGTASSIGTLTFATAPALNGTTFIKIDRNAGSPLADKIVLTGGTLAYGGILVVTNIGAALQADDTFTLFNAPLYGNSFSGIQLPGGYTWDTSQLKAGGTIEVTGISEGGSPAISSITVSGNDIVLNATNGTPKGPVTVLTSTSLTLPIAQWTTVTTTNFDGSGNFNYTVSGGFSSNTRQQFYVLQTQ